MDIIKKVINPFHCYLNNDISQILNAMNLFDETKNDLLKILISLQNNETKLSTIFDTNIKIKEISDIQEQLLFVNINLENLQKALNYHIICLYEKIIVKGTQYKFFLN